MGYYKVTAKTRVLEHLPGEEFQADIPADQEARLLRSGALTRSIRPPKVEAAHPAVRTVLVADGDPTPEAATHGEPNPSDQQE